MYKYKVLKVFRKLCPLDPQRVTLEIFSSMLPPSPMQSPTLSIETMEKSGAEQVSQMPLTDYRRDHSMVPA